MYLCFSEDVIPLWMSNGFFVHHKILFSLIILRLFSFFGDLEDLLFGESSRSQLAPSNETLLAGIDVAKDSSTVRNLESTISAFVDYADHCHRERIVQSVAGTSECSKYLS